MPRQRYPRPNCFVRIGGVILWLSTLAASGCGGASAKSAQDETVTQPQQAENAATDPATAVKLSEIEKICASLACRPDTPVRLMVDEERYFETTVHHSPYVYDGLVSVLSGEKIHLEGVLKPDGAIADIKYVPTVQHPEQTISISLSQTAEGRVHQSMIMKITSGFQGQLRYKLGIMPPGSDDIFYTSSCPLNPNVPSMEMWPDLVMAVHLTDFHIEDPSDAKAGVCY